MRHPGAVRPAGRGPVASRPLFAALAAALLLTACVDGDPARPASPVLISLAPELVGASNLVGSPISRIRIAVAVDGTGEEVSRETVTVSPDASAWELSVEVDLDATGGAPVVLTVELISVVGGVETVEWSGRIGPLDPRAEAGGVHTVTVYPGPLENLDVVSLVIEDPSDPVLVEGETLALEAAVVSSSGSAQAVWFSLEESVASVSALGLVTTHLPGSARIVAQAGPRADTVSLSVLQALVGAAVTPDSLLARAVGDTAQFTAQGLDPRGAPVSGATFAWSVEDPTVARHVGGGRFETLRHGVTTVSVTATSPASSSLGGRAAAVETASASGKLVVFQGIFALSLSPEELSFTALNRLSTLTAEARRQDGSPYEGAELDWRSTDESVARVDQSGRVRSVGEGSADIVVSADDLEARAMVTVTDEGGGGSELIVAADIDLFSTVGGGAAGNLQLSRNLAANPDRPYVVWYVGNASYFQDEARARSYWAPLASVIESELGLTLMVVGDNELGFLAGIDPEMVASVWVPMPHVHFTETQLDQVEAYLAAGGRIVLFAEHGGFEQVNAVVSSVLYRLGSDVAITGDFLVGTATPLVEDPVTAGIEGVGNNASSWFTLGGTDLGLFENQGHVVIFRAGIGQRRTQGLQQLRMDEAPPGSRALPTRPSPTTVPPGPGTR